MGGRVQSGSRRFTRTRIGIVVFFWNRVGSLGRAYRSSGSFGFAWARLGATRGSRVHSGYREFTGAGQVLRRVHSGSHCFTLASQEVVGLCGIAWVHLGAPMCRRLHPGSRWFTLARHVTVCLIRVRVG